MTTLGTVLQGTGQWPSAEHTPVLLSVILLAALGTVVLFVLSLVVYSRRPTARYLLVTVALGALVFRTAVGLGTVFGYVPMTVHHLVEHGLDFLIAALILTAVYLSGSSPNRDVEADSDAD
ncbi:MAG: hypothetical protein QXG03_01650 [Halalkalicoccus sp.]